MSEREEQESQSNGFLSRWSRRKADARQRVVPPEPTPAPTAQAAPAAPTPACDSTPLATGGERGVDRLSSQEAAAVRPAPLSLDDVQALTAESDFSPFMVRGVAPGVRNAAMKKLFADPRFNVMDGLDTYIDDYSKTTPLPAAMLKRMASAQVLGLFDEQATAEATPDAGGVTTDQPATDTAALSPQPAADVPAVRADGSALQQATDDPVVSHALPPADGSDSRMDS